MPTPYIEKESKKHHEPISETERAWERAKEIAKKSNNGGWGEVVDIFKNIEGNHVKKKN